MDTDSLLLRQGNISATYDARHYLGKVRGRSVILINPKYPHNVGTILRACSCFGFDNLIITGTRVSIEADDGYRLPREERMKGYANVRLIRYDLPFNLLAPDTVCIAVELLPKCESMPMFQHPPSSYDAAYVFGQEDGGIPKQLLRFCRRFVSIPTTHCVNLAAAVYITMYARLAQQNPQAHAMHMLNEERGRA